MSEINNRIQQIVNERFGGNKTQFANAIGVKQTTVSNYLTRNSSPSGDVLARIVEHLGVDARWLLTGKEYSLNGISATDSPLTGASVLNSDIFIGVPSEIRDIVSRYESTIKEKEAQMQEKERLIAEKDERIKELKERIEELKAQLK